MREIAAGRGARSDSSLPRRKLLYVEDSDQNWMVAELRLGKQFELIRAANDREACAVLIEHGENLCAVLMDIELIGSSLNGMELAMLIRGSLPEDSMPIFARAVGVLAVPILFVTAHGQSHSEASVLRAGGNGLISKPVDFKLLNMSLMRLQVERLSSRTKGK